jgi:hypothetical protein
MVNRGREAREPAIGNRGAGGLISEDRVIHSVVGAIVAVEIAVEVPVHALEKTQGGSAVGVVQIFDVINRREPLLVFPDDDFLCDRDCNRPSGRRLHLGDDDGFQIAFRCLVQLGIIA